MAAEEGSGPDHAAESRFAHLLKPIRDLAENWSVDIAHELEDYLHEVKRVPIAGPRGVTLVSWRRLRAD
jgi:condensin-2 complex subunit H2